MPPRTAISSILRCAAMLALVCLAACDRFKSPQARAQACVRRFSQMLQPLPAHWLLSSTTVRYTFELRNPDPALERDGIEGVAPSRYIEIAPSRHIVIGVPRAPAPTRDAVDEVMIRASRANAIPAPSLLVIRGEQTWLVYATRPSSQDQALRQLAAMCALAGRGAFMRSISVGGSG